jgi:hypothetical protein
VLEPPAVALEPPAAALEPPAAAPEPPAAALELPAAALGPPAARAGAGVGAYTKARAAFCAWLGGAGTAAGAGVEGILDVAVPATS